MSARIIELHADVDGETIVPYTFFIFCSPQDFAPIKRQISAEFRKWETAHRRDEDDDDDDYYSDSVKSLVTHVLADFVVMYYVAGLNYVRTESSYADIDLALEY